MGALERRVTRLERRLHIDADIDRASAIVHAYWVVNHHPEQATDADRALAAATSSEEWQRAFVTVINAAGGLAAVVRQSEAMDVSTQASPTE